MKIKIQIELNKKTASVDIGADSLYQILSKIPCNKDTKEFFQLVSEIQSEKIQETIAQMDKMFPEILDNLSLKNSANVLRNLVRNDNYRKYITTEQALKLVNDNYTIEAIISNYEHYEEVDAQTLLQKLVSSPNPDIRQMIADGYNVPKKYKKILLNDEDADVRATAAKSLEN